MNSLMLTPFAREDSFLILTLTHRQDCDELDLPMIETHRINSTDITSTTLSTQ